MDSATRYDVIVGNIGTVYEPVTMMADGEIVRESFSPPAAHCACCGGACDRLFDGPVQYCSPGCQASHVMDDGEEV